MGANSKCVFINKLYLLCVYACVVVKQDNSVLSMFSDLKDVIENFIILT